jgi:hypothetical protein
METVLAAALVGVLGYTIWRETKDEHEETAPPPEPKRLCDYVIRGGTYEPASEVVATGRRLLEVHLYSDENGNPIVSKVPLNGGYDYAYDNWTFDSVCVALIQAFPSKHPFILSIVPHTTNVVTLNKAADCLKTTVHRNLLPQEYTDPQTIQIEALANKLIIVSGGVHGSELADLVNMSWTDSHLRRLTFGQAVHPRDYSELVAFNRNSITLVAPDPVFGKEGINPEVATAYGCQWILFGSTPGLVEKPAGLQ